MRYQLAAFDLDGTLVDSVDDLVHVMELLLAETGRPGQSAETLRGYIGWGIRTFVRLAMPDLPPAGLDRMVEAFRRIYWEHLVDTTAPFPGIIDMLDALSGLTLAVFTNKADDFTREILRRLGLLDRFAMVVGLQSVTRPKPDPEGLFLLLRGCSVPAAAALYTGDSALDIQAGRAASVITCAAAWSPIRPVAEVLAAGPHHVLNQPADLVDIARS
ncbi:HAD-IA family hydrolase [bacterium]|nr:HAD-IA family hydrolase [candidate division CSSED10-310 bacterium]